MILFLKTLWNSNGSRFFAETFFVCSLDYKSLGTSEEFFWIKPILAQGRPKLADFDILRNFILWKFVDVYVVIRRWNFAFVGCVGAIRSLLSQKTFFSKKSFFDRKLWLLKNRQKITFFDTLPRPEKKWHYVSWNSLGSIFLWMLCMGRGIRF